MSDGRVYHTCSFATRCFVCGCFVRADEGCQSNPIDDLPEPVSTKQTRDNASIITASALTIDQAIVLTAREAVTRCMRNRQGTARILAKSMSMAHCNGLKNASTDAKRLVDRLSLVQQNTITLKLSQTQVCKNTTDAYTDAIGSLALYVLPGLGYVYPRAEWFSKCGSLQSLPEMFLPCGTHSTMSAAESIQSISCQLCIPVQLSS